MTSHEKTMKALKGRKTGMTVPELVAKTGLNPNTVRRVLGVSGGRGRYGVDYLTRKCRISGKMRAAYICF